MNWGYKIAIGYSVFVILILALVYKSAIQKVDLVTEDYYEEELKFQQQIDNERNASNLETPIRLKQTGNELQLIFPPIQSNEKITGLIHFYKPDNKELDQKIDININENGIQFIDITQFPSGYYQLKIDWIANAVSYFQVEELFL